MTIKISDVDGDGNVYVTLPYNFSYVMVSAPDSFENWWSNHPRQAAVFGDYFCYSTAEHHVERDSDGQVVKYYYIHHQHWTYDTKYISVSPKDIIEFDPIIFAGYRSYATYGHDEYFNNPEPEGNIIPELLVRTSIYQSSAKDDHVNFIDLAGGGEDYDGSGNDQFDGGSGSDLLYD